MSYKKFGIRLAKNTAIGGVAGSYAASWVSHQDGKDAAANTGAKVGGAIGALSALPGGKIARSLYTGGAVFTRGLRNTPGSKVGAALNKSAQATAKASGGAKMVFRRIRGRIIAIRAKQ